MNKYVRARIVRCDTICVEPPCETILMNIDPTQYACSDIPFWNWEQLNTASVSGLPPLTRSAGAAVPLFSVNYLPRVIYHSLFGFEMVLVAPTGLVMFAFVQSANWYQYFVSALSRVASTFTVKSTSYDVKASPESTGLPANLGLSKILKETQTGTL